MQTEQRVTAYYFSDDTGAIFKQYGHTWFSLQVARQIGREHGEMYFKSTTSTIKEVVVTL